jgi:hypothetical protein
MIQLLGFTTYLDTWTVKCFVYPKPYVISSQKSTKKSDTLADKVASLLCIYLKSCTISNYTWFYCNLPAD